jgi:hypothetical protein
MGRALDREGMLVGLDGRVRYRNECRRYAPAHGLVHEHLHAARRRAGMRDPMSEVSLAICTDMFVW